MKTKSCTGCSDCVRAAFSKRGFARYDTPITRADDLIALKQAYIDLPDDPNVKIAGTRKRRHGVFVYDPADGSIAVLNRHFYQQAETFNAEACGAPREFGALGALASNSAILEMIKSSISRLPAMIPKFMLELVYCNVHLIRTIAKPEAPGLPSPPYPHKDGEPATVVVLLERKNIQGGENWVLDNNKNRIATFTLDHSLDTFVVNDQLVYHHVTPVEVAPGFSMGWRDTVLIDFAPCVRQMENPFHVAA